VTWRASTDAAVAAGALVRDDADALMACVRARPYPERRAEVVHGDLVVLGWTPAHAAAALRAVRTHRVDVKADDARAVLSVARGAVPRAPRTAGWPPPRWRRDRVLRTPREGADGAAWVMALAADAARRRRAAVEAIALAWAERSGLLWPFESAEPSGLWPPDLAARARAERAALAAVAAHEGSVEAAALAWCVAHGLPAAFDDPGALGLPWEPEAAVVDAWWREQVR
jgi:hypothetical protein